MITCIFQRSQGMAQISRRLFAQVPQPGLHVAWAVEQYDPFTLLENELARIIGLSEETTQAEPSQQRAAENFVRPRVEAPGLSSTGAASAPLAPQQPAADRKLRSASPQFGRRQLASPSLLPSMSPFVFPRSEDGNHHVSETVKPAALRPASRGNAFPMQEHKSRAFPQFTYGASGRAGGGALPHQPRVDRWHGAVLRPEHGGGSLRIGDTSALHHDLPEVAAVSAPASDPDVDVRGAQKPAGAFTSDLQHSQSSRKSRLVQASTLIHLLKKNTTPARGSEFSSSAPAAVPGEAAMQQPTVPASRPASALTVEAVLEEFEDRLRFEFLRTYGSSGE